MNSLLYEPVHPYQKKCILSRCPGIKNDPNRQNVDRGQESECNHRPQSVARNLELLAHRKRFLRVFAVTFRARGRIRNRRGHRRSRLGSRQLGGRRRRRRGRNRRRSVSRTDAEVFRLGTRIGFHDLRTRVDVHGHDAEPIQPRRHGASPVGHPFGKPVCDGLELTRLAREVFLDPIVDRIRHRLPVDDDVGTVECDLRALGDRGPHAVERDHVAMSRSSRERRRTSEEENGERDGADRSERLSRTSKGRLDLRPVLRLRLMRIGEKCEDPPDDRADGRRLEIHELERRRPLREADDPVLDEIHSRVDRRTQLRDEHAQHREDREPVTHPLPRHHGTLAAFRDIDTLGFQHRVGEEGYEGDDADDTEPHEPVEQNADGEERIEREVHVALDRLDHRDEALLVGDVHAARSNDFLEGLLRKHARDDLEKEVGAPFRNVHAVRGELCVHLHDEEEDFLRHEDERDAERDGPDAIRADTTDEEDEPLHQERRGDVRRMIGRREVVPRALHGIQPDTATTDDGNRPTSERRTSHPRGRRRRDELDVRDDERSDQVEDGHVPHPPNDRQDVVDVQPRQSLPDVLDIDTQLTESRREAAHSSGAPTDAKRKQDTQYTENSNDDTLHGVKLLKSDGYHGLLRRFARRCAI